MTHLTSLRNIGPKSARWLMKVGVYNVEDLIEVGVVNAFLRAKAAFPDQVSLNLLYALQGGMLDISLRDLPNQMKAELRRKVGEN
jgi:hypothetical protein